MDKIVKIILIILTLCIITGVCFRKKENFAKNKILKKKCKNLGRKFKNGKCTNKCLNKKFKFNKNKKKCIRIKNTKKNRKKTKNKTKKSKGKQSKKDNLIIASLLPLSGDLADLGPGIALGASLAVKQVNAAGGVNGQPVQLIESDSSCPGEMASQSFNDIIAQGAQGVIGPVCTGTAFDILDTAIKNKIVMVSPASTSPQFTKIDKKGFFARTIPSDTLIGDALASLLVEDGIKTISIITRSDTYGRNIAKSITTVFEAAGRTVMKTVYYDSDESDFTGDVTNLVKNGIPDAFVGILIKNACNILESALKQNLLDIPWYFSDDVKDARFYSSCSLKNKLDGFKGVSPGSTPGKGKDAFEAAYAKVSKDGRPTFPSAPEAYDATMLIILSAIKNGVTGPEISSGLVDVSSTGGKKCTGVECIELAKKGENFEYVGASGTIKLNSKGDRTTATYDIWQIQGDENPIIKQIIVNSKSKDGNNLKEIKKCLTKHLKGVGCTSIPTRAKELNIENKCKIPYNPKMKKKVHNHVKKICNKNKPIPNDQFKQLVYDYFVGGRDIEAKPGIIIDMPDLTQSKTINIIKEYGKIEDWNVSQVKDMSRSFSMLPENEIGLSTRVLTYYCDLSNWDVSNVTNMMEMFGKFKFSRDRDALNGSNVNSSNKDIYCPRSQALKKFTEGLIAVKSGYYHPFCSLQSSIGLKSRFHYIERLGKNSIEGNNFNSDLSNWDVSNVTNMAGMFINCYEFDASTIKNWNVSNVTNMRGMFNNASLNIESGKNKNNKIYDFSKWNVSKVTDVSYMFSNDYGIGLDKKGHKIEISGISSWKLPKVKYMDCFLQGAKINEDFSHWKWPENKIPTHYDFVRNIIKDYWPPQFRKDYGRLKPDIKFKVKPSYNKDTQKLTFTIWNDSISYTRGLLQTSEKDDYRQNEHIIMFKDINGKYKNVNFEINQFDNNLKNQVYFSKIGEVSNKHLGPNGEQEFELPVGPLKPGTYAIFLDIINIDKERNEGGEGGVITFGTYPRTQKHWKSWQGTNNYAEFIVPN